MKENIKFQLKVWNTLTMSNGCIAIEIQPHNSENRKWASIYPLEKGDERGIYRYFEIELPKNIVENDLDWFKDDEITEEVFVSSLDELYNLLETKKLDPLSFDVPWKFNFPYHY
jgi:hypothetical protein